MFKSRSKKNKIKAVFKLQFQATQVPKMKKSTVMIALVPDDVGKPKVKLEKVSVQDGTCLWEKPIFESVKLVRDTKSGKLQEKIYHFVVSTGSSKSGFLGESSIDLADFAAETEPLTVSLPLKFANSGAILHVRTFTFRNEEDNGNGSLRHQLSICSADEGSHNVHVSVVQTCSENEAILFNYDHANEEMSRELLTSQADLNEVTILKERNEYMGTQLKEMEERYSEISLKFAEVEGERQQLVMALRNLRNGKN
uniref:C2 NT-type domain-containing protein n=1 Tax=Cajanus cajan TaxID=3821 RepID=A0A151RHE6_CAJCA|nr:hypothetical protein KK1_036659 [Cajanus cajan]